MSFKDQIKRDMDQAKRENEPLTGHQKKLDTEMRAAWLKSPAKVLERCQKTFNMMIRMEAADDDGICRCFVTGTRHHFKSIDAGHFISATKQATRFDEMNVHPQSKASNQFDTTNDSLIYYTIGMTSLYGATTVDDLLKKSKQPKKWTIAELIPMRIEWMDRIKTEKARLGE